MLPARVQGVQCTLVCASRSEESCGEDDAAREDARDITRQHDRAHGDLLNCN